MSRTSDIGLLAGVLFVFKDFLVQARYVCFSKRQLYTRQGPLIFILMAGGLFVFFVFKDGFVQDSGELGLRLQGRLTLTSWLVAASSAPSSRVVLLRTAAAGVGRVFACVSRQNN